MRYTAAYIVLRISKNQCIYVAIMFSLISSFYGVEKESMVIAAAATETVPAAAAAATAAHIPLKSDTLHPKI